MGFAVERWAASETTSVSLCLIHVISTATTRQGKVGLASLVLMARTTVTDMVL
jgi:hypothetical protein